MAFAVAAIALACQSTYYDEYKAAHPGFEPALPRVDASLEEVLAALYAPNPLELIEVGIDRLAIFRTDQEDWSEIAFDAVRQGRFEAVPEGDYAVLVGWLCTFDLGLKSGDSRRSGYYLLPNNGLAAYDHYRFREGCGSANEFRAARGPLVVTEIEAFDRVSSAGRRYSLAEAYRRGLAYVEAGRLQEARAMLVMGERSYRAVAQQLRASGRLDALADAQRMRESLMRALGVEPRP
jgi:hypothetical protein